ncbi:MAG: glycoside hydrolase family 3 C-terminal domain-containing protein [Terracidiphilus sp.]
MERSIEGQPSTSSRATPTTKSTPTINLLIFAALIVSALAVRAQGAAPQVTGDARVDQLLSRMTLDEKIQLVHGTGEDALTGPGQAGYLEGIPRLGIPSLRLADGPPGVLTRIPAEAPTATMGLAATFSLQDARANGRVVADEARDRGIDVVLQPFINMDRDFRWGRGYNTYGEDPLLTGLMGADFIRGVQGQGIMSQAKHYVAYDTDAPFVIADLQALHEIYVAPFADAVKAGVSSIMCSYNKINGKYACGNNDTLNEILKGELGFKGFVTSDWGATHGTDFINFGLDLEMPGPLPVAWTIPSFFVNNPPRQPFEGGSNDGPALTAAGLPEEPKAAPWVHVDEPKVTTDLKHLVEQGVVSESTIDHAAGRVLYEMDKFGMLDGKKPGKPTAAELAEDQAAIRRTATDAAVLLKNESILPLKLEALSNVALIGPGAGQLVAVGLTGEKAVGLPQREVSPLAALRQAAGAGAHLSYAAANDMDGTPVPAQYFSHFGQPGLERRAFKEFAVHIDPSIDFTNKAHSALPPRESIEWTGTLTVPEAGDYRLHLQLLGCNGKLKIDDQVVASVNYNWIHGNITQAGQDNIFPTTDGLDNLRAQMHLTAGEHRFYLAIGPDSSNNPEQVRFNWVTPEQQRQNYQDAIETARKAKVAIVFAWSRLRPDFGLPGDQDKLIADIAAVNPNTIVVLNLSQPVAMPWLDKVKAVLQMWWPGDEGGWATADLLLGRANPAGRLPFTWPHKAQDMPAADPAYPERGDQGINNTATYSEGIFVGYRWFDKQGIDPLYPFGYGLSYTHFSYSGLKVEPSKDDGADVSFAVKNAGAVAGDEVPQVYLSAPADAPSGAEFAVRALAGFTRIHLAAGASQTVSIHFDRRRFQYWSTKDNSWQDALGVRTVSVGASERDLRLNAQLVMGK